MAASAVKRLLASSPLSFSRSQSSDGKLPVMSQPYFGIPLLDIVRREGTTIPNLVSKIASFLLERGLDQVGIFRVSGNSKVMERLRTSFDRNGDAALTDTIDVMAVAGLLKLFFRELPETLIPERLTQHFVAAQEASFKDPDGYVREIKRLLATLPECNYSTLKYLTAFLVMVAQEESANKMNANALATIFGPNMFRCTSGLPGLKEQGITNGVMFDFIRKYNDLFLESGESSPYNDGFQLSDVILSKPSPSVLHHDVRPSSASRLIFQAADAPIRPTSSGDTTDGSTSHQPPSSATVSSYQQYADRNINFSERPKTSQLASTPMLAVIQEAIDQAILEYVFGETVESFPESDEMPDESDNSWSLSDDDNRAPQLQYPQRLAANNVQPSAKAIDSDSVSDSEETSSNDSDTDNRRQRRSDAVTKTSSEVQTHDRDWAAETETKSRRPVSGFGNRAEEPVSSASQHRATSAPTRPSSIGTKENLSQANNTTTGNQYSRNNNYSNRRNDQGSMKSPLVEKQAWSLETGDRLQEGKSSTLRPQHSADDLPTRGHPKDSGAAEREEQCLAEFKRLTKQIHACKKKVKEFEEDFEAKHGYKPMHSDRVGNKEVRRCLEELPEARRQLNELRSTMESIKDDRRDDRLSGGSRKTTTTTSPPSIEETLATLVVKLKEKRQVASRPESLTEMTKKEICEEKLCIQKALLHFETIHGRPSTAGEKEIMHPLYDRYRRIKRLLEKMSDCSADEDIQSVPGNLSFVSATTQSTAYGAGAKGTSTRSNRNNPVYSPTKSHSSSRSVFTIGRADPLPVLRQPEPPVQRRKTDGTGTKEAMGRMLNDDENLNLNQLSIPRLMSELQRTKAEKKRLQLALHNFEEDFQRENGRKIQKYDQLPLEAEYKQYKTIKAKLKLLEVLVAKHQQTK